jgi:hypothetical protein
MDKYSTRWLNHRTFHATIGFSTLQISLGQLPPSNLLFTQGEDKEDIINHDDGNLFCDDNGANLDDNLDNEDDSKNITLSSLAHQPPKIEDLHFNLLWRRLKIWFVWHKLTLTN